MRLIGLIACWIVALDCVLYATKGQPQHIYADSMIWLWWVAVVFWAVYGLAFITHNFD